MKGAAEMVTKIRAIAMGFPPKVEAALMVEAQGIFDASQERIPVDKGDLKATGKIDSTYAGTRVTATISYTGPQAVAIHEHLSEHSPHSWQVAEGALPYKDPNKKPGGVHWTAPGTGPKYLEGPQQEAEVGMLARLAVLLSLENS